MSLMHCNKAVAAASLATLLALASSPTFAQGFSGTVTNGTTSAAGTFSYDTENGSGTLLDQSTAAAAGLGTVSGGVFTPSVPAVSIAANNGTVTMWCFPSVKVCVKDSNNKDCCLETVVCVVKDQTGSNPTMNVNLLSQTWINGVKACLAGAGPTAKGYWNPGWTPPASQTSTGSTTNGANGKTQKTVGGKTGGAGGSKKDVRYIYKSTSSHSFVPLSVVDALNLPIIGTQDIDDATRTALAASDLNRGNKTVFPVAVVESIELDVGHVLSGNVLVIDDSDSTFGVLGADLITKHHLYANGAMPNGEDMLAYCPGAAYPYGAGCAGSGGFVPFLGVDGCMSPGGTYSVTAAQGLGGAAALIVIGSGAGNVPVTPSCTLLVDPITTTLPITLTGSGAGNGGYNFDVILPLNQPPMTFRAQLAVADTGVPDGVALSNGLEVVIE